MLVSVIMPTYNCGRYIEESIRSVQAQTVTDWELQIVDDASTDNTREVLAPYLAADPRLHYYCLPSNQGPAAARTEALKRASGRYVAFLDSDDIWYPEKLEKQIAFMAAEGVPFSCTAYRLMSADGEDRHTALFPPAKVDYKRCIRLSNPIGNLTVMYDQEALGRFEVPPIRKRNDFALWLQVLKTTPYCAGLPEVLAAYRQGREGSVSRNKLAQARYHWQLYHEIEGHGALRSACEVLCWAVVKTTGMGVTRRRI